MKKIGRIAALLLILSLALVPGASAKEKATTYGPPYKEGPVSGDRWAMNNANVDDGRIIVGRMYPIFNPISCAAGGAMAKLQLVHKVNKPLNKVKVAYNEAVVDQYSWITLAVRTKDGKWLAGTRQRGPLAGSGEITAPLYDKSPKRGKKVIVQFGLEMASACPQLGGGSARFSEVTLS